MFRIHKDWELWLSRSQKAARYNFQLGEVENFTTALTNWIQNEMSSVDWNAEFSTGLFFYGSNRAQGFFDHISIELVSEAEHTNFVLKGSSARPEAQGPPPNLVLWVKEKLNSTSPWIAARTIFRKGAQSSPNSFIKNRFPPFGRKGIDLPRFVEESGEVEDIVERYGDRIGVDIRNVYG